MTRLPFLASIRGGDGRVLIVEVSGVGKGQSKTILSVPPPNGGDPAEYARGFADGEAAALDSIPLDYLSPDDWSATLEDGDA